MIFSHIAGSNENSFVKFNCLYCGMVLVIQAQKNNHESIFASHMKFFHRNIRPPEDCSLHREEKTSSSEFSHKHVEKTSSLQEDNSWKCSICGHIFSAIKSIVLQYNNHMRQCHFDQIKVRNNNCGIF